MLHSAMMRCIDDLISIENLICSVSVRLGPLFLNRLLNHVLHLSLFKTRGAAILGHVIDHGHPGEVE